MNKRIFQWMLVVAILVASFTSAGGAAASGSCASTITVQWGDTLSAIAVQCGTSVAAIQAANPGLGFWVYAGQVLHIPSGSGGPVYYPPSGGNYVVKWGDTLAKIASRNGIKLSSLLAANPQIYNPSLIYAGQVINLPGGSYDPPPQQPPQPCNCPPSQSDLSTLKINYKHGMHIRSDPNGKILASALNKETVYYYPNSVFHDGLGCTWVKVKIFPPTKGYYEGWLLVRDQLGNFFTSPQID
jgi:LysM repeat protein